MPMCWPHVLAASGLQLRPIQQQQQQQKEETEQREQWQQQQETRLAHFQQ